MAFTRRTQLSNDETGAGTVTTWSLAATYNQAAGDLIVIALTWELNEGSPTVTDVAGNTYVPLTRVQCAGPSTKWHQLWYCLNCLGSAVNNVTVNWGGGTLVEYIHLQVMPYLPGGTATFVAEGTGSGNSASQATASFVAGSLAVAMMGEFSGLNATEGAGWTEQWDVAGNGSHGFDRIDSPGGSITGSSTTSGAVNYGFVAASFSDGGGSTFKPYFARNANQGLM